MLNTETKQITYEENGQSATKPWISENNFSSPKKVIVIDDTFKADQFVALASQGTSFIWKGDFHNAKQLLQAVQRRVKPHVPGIANDPKSLAKEFYRHRQHQAHKAQLLGRMMIVVESDFSVKLPRAPDLKMAISEALAPVTSDFVISLREVLGFIGAHEWRKKGVSIPALDGKTIHAYYGVFSPVRGEYLDLIADAPLNNVKTAFDIGTGTGVISAVLAKRGVPTIIATDMDDRAIACANSNIESLGFSSQITVQKTDLFPDGKADLIVCNPPWVPSKPTSAIERAVYDEDSQMTKGFLKGVGSHLNDNGEAWLVISDLAEHLGLRPIGDLEKWMDDAGLVIIDVLKIPPRHSKSVDVEDSLHFARSKEMTKLYRLKKK